MNWVLLVPLMGALALADATTPQLTGLSPRLVDEAPVSLSPRASFPACGVGLGLIDLLRIDRYMLTVPAVLRKCIQQSGM